MNKPVNCGCGGEAIIYINGVRQAKIYCEKCGIESNIFATKYKAIYAWNRAMGERTAKVKNVDEINVHCGNCDTPLSDWWTYCPSCGSRLEWG